MAMNNDQLQQLLAALPRGGAAPRMPKFGSSDPGEWRVWRANFIAHAAAAGWNAATQRQMLALSMEGEAHRHTRGINIGARDVAAILVDYDQCFLPPQASAAARASFKNARQMPSETILQWKARLRELYVRAHPEREALINADHDMIDTFVDGLLDPQVRIHTRDSAPATLDAASATGQTKEQGVLKENQLRSQPGRMNHIDGPPENNGVGMGRTCFICASASHLMRDCPQDPKGFQAARLRGGGSGQRGGRGGRRGSRGRFSRGFNRNTNSGRGGGRRNNGGGINNIGSEDGKEESSTGDFLRELQRELDHDPPTGSTTSQGN